jgi:hypothetical protein
LFFFSSSLVVADLSVAVDAGLYETASSISNALLGEVMGLAGVNDVYDIRKASDPTDPIVAVCTFPFFLTFVYFLRMQQFFFFFLSYFFFRLCCELVECRLFQFLPFIIASLTLRLWARS